MMETGRAVLLREMLAEKCETCRSGEMPFLWRCPAGVKGWTEGWHHAECDYDGWDDGNLCDASDLIDQQDPTGEILCGEVYDTACVCPCHEGGYTAFGEDPGACARCDDAPNDYAERIGLAYSDPCCVIGHLIQRADEAESEVEPLVALLRRAWDSLTCDGGVIRPCTDADKCDSCKVAADIRAALKAHEERSR